MDNLFFVFLFLFLIALNVAFLLLIIYSFTLAPWLPMERKDLPRINKIANLKPQQIFCEVGCGDGRVCSFIAKNNPHANVVGIEINWLLYLISYIRKLLYKQDNLKLFRMDAVNFDLTNVDVLYTYITAKSLNGVFKNKILRELKEGAIFVSYFFKLSEWNGPCEISRPSKKDIPIFIYKRKN